MRHECYLGIRNEDVGRIAIIGHPKKVPAMSTPVEVPGKRESLDTRLEPDEHRLIDHLRGRNEYCDGKVVWR